MRIPIFQADITAQGGEPLVYITRDVRKTVKWDLKGAVFLMQTPLLFQPLNIPVTLAL